MSDIDLQPGIGDVLQEEGDSLVTVPVCLVEQKSPMRTQALPRKAGTTMTKILTTTPRRILRADHRRARVTVVSTDATSAGIFLIAFSQASASDPSTMSVWPGGQPFRHEADTEVWLAAAASTVTVGIITESWAEGDDGK